VGTGKFDAYVRALKDLTGLGQNVAFPTGLSRKGFRSANVTDIFAFGAQSPACLVLAEPSTSNQIGPDALAAVVTAIPRPDGGDVKEAKTKPEPRTRRGGRRKGETAEAIGSVQSGISEPKRALTVNEAEKLYSISRSSLYKLIDAGILPDVVVAGRRLIPRDSLEALIAGKRP
jgi:excisionase family DNA binding protein